MAQRLSIAIGFTLVAASLVAAQQKPNFSGRWVQVTAGDGAGLEQTVVQTETELRLIHGSSGDDHHLSYRLDGQEGTSKLRMHDADIVTVSRAEWKGDKLSIASTTTYDPTRKLDQIMLWSLDEKGQLVIELTATMTGRKAESRRILYRKVPAGGSGGIRRPASPVGGRVFRPGDPR